MILQKIVSEFEKANLSPFCEKRALFEEISSLSCDSRTVTEGTLFFVKGVQFKSEFLTEAIEKGAVAYVSEKDMGVALPRVAVSDVRLAMPVAAKRFYGDPLSSFSSVGITGTKGKTTVATMLKNIFDETFSSRSALMSTNGAFVGTEALEKSGGSTPEALE